MNAKDKNNIDDKIKNLPTKNNNISTKDCLDTIENFIKRWVILGQHEINAATLYVAMTYVYRSFYVIPYLHIKSAVNGSGKTNLMQILVNISSNASDTDDITAAAIASEANDGLTLLIDQIDTLMERDKDLAKALEGIFNGGYKKSGKRKKMANDNTTVITQKTFCPKILSGIEIPFPDSTQSRCIPIEINRATHGELETIEEFWIQDIEEQSPALRQMLDDWGETVAEKLSTKKQMKLSDDLEPRGKEIWKSLLRIAELAGKEWYRKAWDSSVQLSGLTNKPREKSDSEKLLEDIKKVFAEKGDPTRIESNVLVNALLLIEEAEWMEYRGKGLTKTQMARLLKRFKDESLKKTIKPTKWRQGTETIRGYYLMSFREAFKRYVPSVETDTSATSGTNSTNDYIETEPNNNPVADVAFVADDRQEVFVYDPDLPTTEAQQKQKFDLNWGNK